MTQAKNSMVYPTIHPVEMLQADNSPVKTNYEPSVKVKIGGAVTQAQFKFGEWYPIELAPKDGTSVLLYIKHGLYCVGLFFPLINGFIGEYLRNGLPWQPTHWMPLPPAPTNTKEEK